MQKGKVKDYFNYVSDDYLQVYTETLPSDSIQAYIFQERKKYILNLLGKNGGRVLDVGCGPAIFIHELLERGCQVWGVDISHKMIEHAKKILGENELTAKVEFLVGDTEHLSFPNNFFDCVLCVGVLEYIDNEKKSLEEISRVLKPGGELILTVPNIKSPFNKLDRSLMKLFRVCFHIYRYLSMSLGREVYLPEKKLSLRTDVTNRLYSPRLLDQALAREGLQAVEKKYHIYRFAFLNPLIPGFGIWLSRKRNIFEKLRLEKTGVNCIIKAVKKYESDQTS
ncbi:MAG: class I SAM-dependent methyltransferase [Desulfobacterales bacterium]|nr:class I SAM-dependent methyltransferase [Desulfobacterales bacterium]